MMSRSYIDDPLYERMVAFIDDFVVVFSSFSRERVARKFRKGRVGESAIEEYPLTAAVSFAIYTIRYR